MDNNDEEPEIKIEYNESYDVDPLQNNFGTELGESNSYLSLISTQFNEIIEGNAGAMRARQAATNILPDACSIESRREEISNPTTHQYTKDNKISTIQHNETTWYKEIDESGRYICRFCDLSYSTIQSLRYHNITKHSDHASALKSLIINNKRQSKLKCHICKWKFKLLTDLQNHIDQIHDVKNLRTSCNHCDATFQNEEAVLNHMLLEHKMVTKSVYSCHICGYRTLKKSHFHQHTNTHSTEKIYKCSDCSYNTNYLPNLKIHERIHNAEKPYSCDYKNCTYRCSAKSGLRSHQLKHYPEENMLFCDKCSYKTVYKQSLKKHIDSHVRNSIKLVL